MRVCRCNVPRFYLVERRYIVDRPFNFSIDYIPEVDSVISCVTPAAAWDVDDYLTLVRVLLRLVPRIDYSGSSKREEEDIKGEDDIYNFRKQFDFI